MNLDSHKTLLKLPQVESPFLGSSLVCKNGTGGDFSYYGNFSDCLQVF